jgi:predicted nucleic acid-binding protein
MLIYLDNCTYNRPFDNQKQLRIHLESQAKLYIQEMIKSSLVKLASSFILLVEINRSPHNHKKENISNFVRQNTSVFVGVEKTSQVSRIIQDIIPTGIKEMDASHIACAIIAGCEYFITTDKRLLKYQSDKIKLLNPVDFVTVLEENND